MTPGPPHTLAPLLLEHSNLRPAALAVDDRDDLGVCDVGRARQDLAAVLLDEQHLLDRQLVAGFTRGSVNGHETAGRHLGLTTAVLDDRVHNRHLCKGVSVTPKSFGCKGLAESGSSRTLLEEDARALDFLRTERAQEVRYEPVHELEVRRQGGGVRLRVVENLFAV